MREGSHVALHHGSPRWSSYLLLVLKLRREGLELRWWCRMFEEHSGRNETGDQDTTSWNRRNPYSPRSSSSHFHCHHLDPQTTTARALSLASNIVLLAYPNSLPLRLTMCWRCILPRVPRNTAAQGETKAETGCIRTTMKWSPEAWNSISVRSTEGR